jgi:hypothetical protein
MPNESKTTECGWLIERQRGEDGDEPIRYFYFVLVDTQGREVKHWSWTGDNIKASRFARKIDAELAWQCMTGRPLEGEVDIVEHGWG